MNKIFNEARMAYQGQILSGKEITTLLSEIPNSSNGLFLTVLVKHNAIKHVGKNQYMFTTEPIHHNVLEAAINDIREKQRAYCKKYNKKKKQPVAEEKSDIQKAIDLLLSTGDYEIFKIEKIVTVKKTQL